MNISDKLYDILSHSIDWVKYAEGKIGALLALNSFIFIRLLFIENSTDTWVNTFFLAGLSSFFISIVISFFALIPIVNYKKIVAKMNMQEEKEVTKMYDLLVTKEDLKISPENFLKFYYKSHQLSDNTSLPIESLCVEQIFIQKYMRYRKFTYFNRAVITTVIGFLCLLIVGVVNSIEL